MQPSLTKRHFFAVYKRVTLWNDLIADTVKCSKAGYFKQKTVVMPERCKVCDNFTKNSGVQILTSCKKFW